MKRIKDILNLPVIALDTGKKIGRVADVVYQVNSKKLVALLVERATLLNSKQAVTIENVINIGNDTVTITSANNLHNPDTISDVYQALQEQRFDKQRLINYAGDQLGIIDDIVIDENSGMIVAMDISGGIISDLLYGQKRMELPDSFSLSKANCILRKGDEDEYMSDQLPNMRQ